MTKLKKKTRKIKKVSGKKSVKTKNKQSSEEFVTQSQLGAIVERFDHKLDLVLENQETIKNELKVELKEWFQKDFGTRIERLESGMYRMEGRFDRLEKKVDNLEIEMKKGFTSIFEYLSKVEDELLDINKRIKNLEGSKFKEKDFEKMKKKVESIEEKVKVFEVFLKRKGLLDQASAKA